MPTPTSTPVLRGPRVRLEPIDPQLARAMLAAEPRPGLAWERGFPMAPVLGIAGVIAASGGPPGPFPAFVIIRESDGLAIGDAGFHGPPDEHGEVEIGYALVPAARGSGLATEAAGLLVEWAQRDPGVAAITARVDRGNAPSERLLARLGFRPDPAVPGAGGRRDGLRRFVLRPAGRPGATTPG